MLEEAAALHRSELDFTMEAANLREVSSNLRAAGIDAVVVAASRYRDTAFTDAVLRGARFVIAPTIAERVEATVDLLGGADPTLVAVRHGRQPV